MFSLWSWEECFYSSPIWSVSVPIDSVIWCHLTFPFMLEHLIVLSWFGWYCGLKVCVPTKLTCWHLIPRVMVLGSGAFERWLSHESGWSPYKSHPRKLPCPFCHVKLQWKDGHLGSSLSPDIECVRPMILDFPGSRTVRNKCLLFINLLVYGILV